MIYEHEDCGKYQDCPYRSDVGWCPLTCLQYRHKDDVRVVRCKDCASGKGATHKVCPLYRDGLMKDDDYCSVGERKGND